MKNDPRIEFTDRFDQQRKAAPHAIKEAFLAALALFLAEPEHPALRDHPLHGKLAGYRSIDVTEDWRALYKREVSSETVTIKFDMIGTHKQLYG
jgi:addiction module RelE/StbE family toxin